MSPELIDQQLVSVRECLQICESAARLALARAQVLQERLASVSGQLSVLAASELIGLTMEIRRLLSGEEVPS